ncbi:hypothetical protein CR194_13475 [Salipaludibacillus keqinensis]|uniref:Zinc-ribbon domain-containing protein n=1 Tax=Salipaludibacillus keqinensis TaxID=2045207 RepID=A0A323TBZ8_9BACI|nr:zinc-ribbon domain-containing protein [Salipaludibacillus keqinensis]PYZ92671.1 hypothetical protein CR194_13475 [Salipaludibacillus keqinensis]
MVFCTSCGEKLDPHSSFCQACGTKHESSPSKNNQDLSSELSASERPTPPSAPPSQVTFTKKQKKIAAGVASVFILGFGLFKVGESLTDGEKVASGFQDAVIEQDTEAVLDYLTVENWDGELTKDHANELIKYFHTDTSTLGTFENYIDEQIFRLNSHDNAASAEYGSGYSGLESLSFQQTGKSLFVYDKYEFTLDTFPLLVYTNHQDTEFLVNGDEVEKRATQEGYYSLGKFPPGTYDISGLLETEFVELDTETSVYHFYQDSPIDVTFNLHEVYIDSNVEGATLFVNDSETDVITSPDGELFGPVVLDGSLHVHLEKETPFGSLSTEAVPLEGDYYEYSLDFSFPSSILEEAIEDLSSELTDSYELLKTGNSDVEVLESIKLYTDGHYLLNHHDTWRLFIDSEEQWQREVSTWFSNSTTIQEETDYKSYTLIFSEEEGTWGLEEYFSLSNLSTEGESYSKLTISDDEMVSEMMEEDTLAAYREDIDEELHSLFHNFLDEYSKATRSEDTYEVLTYIDEDSSSYEEKVRNQIHEFIEEDTQRSYLDVSLIDYSSDDDLVYDVSIQETFNLNENDTKFSKEKEYTFEVKLTNEGFKIIDLLESEILNKEEI